MPSRHKQDGIIMIGLVVSMNDVRLWLMALSKAASQDYEERWPKFAIRRILTTMFLTRKKDYGTKILEEEC